MFDDAIHIYEKALKEIGAEENKIKIKSYDLLLIKTALWNNIGLCYK